MAALLVMTGDVITIEGTEVQYEKSVIRAVRATCNVSYDVFLSP